MISYELAKELKEAGFPQKTNEGWITDDGKKFHRMQHYEVFYTEKVDHIVVIPTLSELISVCGKQFDYLKLTDNNKWRTFMKYGPEGYQGNECDSPEQSVANLWLELNKKL